MQKYAYFKEFSLTLRAISRLLVVEAEKLLLTKLNDHGDRKSFNRVKVTKGVSEHYSK